jgi:hypothetical protein
MSPANINQELIKSCPHCIHLSSHKPVAFDKQYAGKFSIPIGWSLGKIDAITNRNVRPDPVWFSIENSHEKQTNKQTRPNTVDFRFDIQRDCTQFVIVHGRYVPGALVVPLPLFIQYVQFHTFSSITSSHL